MANCKFKVDNQELSEEQFKSYLLNGGIDRFRESGDLTLEGYPKVAEKKVSSKYKKIKDDAKRIIEGTAIFKRFSPQEQRGIAAGGEIHAEATLLLRGLQEASEETSAANEEQERSIEEIEYQKEEKKEPPKKTSPPKEPPKPPTSTTTDGGDGNIEDYEMTTSGEVNRFLSGDTWEDIFGESPEGNQNYLTQKLSDMLQDGKNMIAIAQKKWGGDVQLYGRQLFQLIQNMSNDKGMTNKKAVLLATFLGELQEAKMRSPERFDAISQLEKAVFAYYQNYMNVRGKEIVAGRLLRLYRDKYIGDIYADKILGKEQVKSKKAITEIEQKKGIDDNTVIEETKPITEEEKKKEDSAAKNKTNNSKKKQSKKKKMSVDEAQERAASKIKEIEQKLGKEGRDGLVDRIKEAIKKLNCK